MGILLKTILFALSLNSAYAQENILSCTEAGNLTHNFIKLKEGYGLLVNFGMYEIAPEFNSETGEFEGQGFIGIDVPVDNDNVRITGMSWINEKAEFFKELFPDTHLPASAPIKTGFFALDFSKEDCVVKEKEGFIYANCRAQGPVVINGVELKYIDFSMQNQIRTTLLSNPINPNDLDVGEVETVYANIKFAKKKGEGTYVYRSSTTYYPNGNDIKCYKGPN